MKAARVDAAHAARDDHAFAAARMHERVELLAPRLGVLLGVVQPREGAPVGEREPLEVEQHGGRDERAGERAPARLVRPGDEAALEASGRKRTGGGRCAAARGARACRCGAAAST